MYKRKIYQKLLQWKEDNKIKKKALVIKGARQVGKTTIVKDFANNEYENVVYLNFTHSNLYNSVFEGDLDVDTIIAKLSLKGDFNFVPYKTIIIMDEIQECPLARTSIKVFCEDGRYDVIATGSLLGVLGYNKKSCSSIPVGFETHIRMHPMDFKEFLWAKGFNEQILNTIEGNVKTLQPIDKFYHNLLMEEYRWYLLIGGMPEAVYMYLETKNYAKVKLVQESILATYRNDFGKYLDYQNKTVINNKDAIKLNKIFDAIPQQLAKVETNENNYTKFRFKDVAPNARFRDYVNALDWLEEAGVVCPCYNTSKIESPISAYKINGQFKLYFNDTGLLIASLSNDARTSIIENKDNTYKGYVYENLVADALSKNDLSLYYYGDYAKEIDFVIPTNKGLLVCEVKSGRAAAKSISKLISSSKDTIKGIKLSNNNIGLMNHILTIPYYLAYLIDEDFEFPEED